MSTGGVIAWGDDTYGQSSPPPETTDGIMAVAAGEKHSLALTDTGEVLAWGDDTLGQATVPAGAQSGVTAIACGWNHSLALKTDGSVIAWGDNGLGQTTVPAEAVGVSAIGAGGNHSVALLNDGTVVAWGDVGEHKAEIKPVAGAGIRSGKAGVPYSASHDAVRIAVGDYQATVVRNDGLLFAWKYLDDAKLPAPEVTGTIAAMASGGKQTLALIGGAVSAWEWDQPSRFTVVTAPTYPVPVDAQSGVVQVAAGGEHALALKSDGSVVAWGSDSHGQVTLPMNVFQDVIVVVGGWLHSLAIGVVDSVGPSPCDGVSILPAQSGSPDLGGNASEAANIGFCVNFFGAAHTSLFVNENGNITFGGAYSGFADDLNTANHPIIAPFYSAVETDMFGGTISYGPETYDGQAAFAVSWVDVATVDFSMGSDTNTFKLILVDRSQGLALGDFDIIFQYTEIKWEEDITQGDGARVGYSIPGGTSGSGEFYQMPGSTVTGTFTDNGTAPLINGSLNSSQPGEYIFQFRGGVRVA